MLLHSPSPPTYNVEEKQQNCNVAHHVFYHLMLYNILLLTFQINEFAGHNDAILIVVIPAMQAPEVASSRALKLARDIDPEGLSFKSDDTSSRKA